MHVENVTLGSSLPHLTAAPVNRTTLALFAGASNDHNPVHIDIDFARRAGLPDVFAHGMLSMAYLGRLLTQWAPQSRLRQFTARFTGITHLGNQLVCTGKVAEVWEANGERLARLELQVTNQYGEQKISGEALVVVRGEC